MWNNYYSDYVRSILYKSCLNSNFEEELCALETSDNKNFIIHLTWNNEWKDGKKISLEDIYFTYNDIVKNNVLWFINPVSNNIVSIEKNKDNIKITFENSSINNVEFFKNPILPKHILLWKTKDYYIWEYLIKFVNSTCVDLDKKSDFLNNIILNYENCEDYYINSYQFLLLNNIKDVLRYLTWANKIDIYNADENLDKNIFEKISIKENIRYAFFFNTLKQTDSEVKSYLAWKILSWLAENISISEKVFFNGYGLFLLPKKEISKEDLYKKLTNQITESQKDEFKNTLKIITWDSINYIYSANNNFFIQNNIKDKITIYWNIWNWKYHKIAISANGASDYSPSSYNWKTFKYILSSTFKNIKEWKNVYTIYSYNLSGDKKKLDTITIYYKNIIYPTNKKSENKNISVPPFVIVYPNEWIVENLWNAIALILSKNYPWEIVVKNVIRKEYEEILKSWNYDMVVWKIKFDGNDISQIFKTDDPLLNPSLFVNQNFASLINQNLLASINLKKNVFESLNKIYKQFIPIVFIWNKKLNLYINKKYNIDKSFDYDSFKNRGKMIKSIVINKMNKPAWNKLSLSWFINFLQENIR